MNDVLRGLLYFCPIALCILFFMRQWRWWPLAAFVLWLPTVLPLFNNVFNLLPLWLYLPLIFIPTGLYGILRHETVLQGIFAEPLRVIRKHPFLTLPGFAVVAICFCAALGPEVRGDSIIYHISAAKLFAIHNRMVEIPTSILTYIPQAQQTLYACCLSADSETLARLMHWFAGVLLAAGTYETARRVLNLSSGLSTTAAMMFLLFPIWTYLASSTYVDLPTGLWILASLYILLLRPNTMERADWKAVALAGILAGAAIGTKYTAGIVGYIPLLCVLVVQQKHRLSAGHDTLSTSVWKIVLFAGIGIAVFSPWLIRNWIWTGNPVCPVMMSLLGPADVPASTLTWGDIQPGPKYVGSVSNVWLLYPAMFWAFGDFGNYLPQLALILGGVCCILRLPKYAPLPVRWILIFLAVSYVIGIPGGAIRRDCRYIMGHVALCSVLAVYWYQVLLINRPEMTRLLTRLGAGCLVLLVLSGANFTRKMFADLQEDFFPPIGQSDREDYCAARLKNYRANNALSLNDKAGVLGAAYPANANYVLGGQPIAERYALPNPETLRPEDLPGLRQMNIEYVLGEVTSETATLMQLQHHCAGLPLYRLRH